MGEIKNACKIFLRNDNQTVRKTTIFRTVKPDLIGQEKSFGI